MRLSKMNVTALFCSAAFLVSSSAFADIVISGTRVIYPQSAKDVTVKMENRGNKPLLVQVWLDDGRDTTNPEELKVPFIVTPPFHALIQLKAKPCVLHGLDKQCLGPRNHVLV